MCLLMQRRLNAYFGLQGVIDFKLFNVNLEHNIKSQLQCTLAFVDATGITTPGVAI